MRNDAGMIFRPLGRQGLLGVTLVLLVLAGCSSPARKAPVEERVAVTRPVSPPATAPALSSTMPAPAQAADTAAKPLPGAENAGKPGYYTVKTGDTLIRIALDSGQNWRDLARWNGMDNPNVVEVGQVLRVVPPSVDPTAVATRAVPGAGRVETRPLDAAPVTTATVPGAPAASAVPPAPITAATSAATPATAAAGSAAPAAAAPDDGHDDLVWIWPARAR